ncbi:MAG: hypothetical protein H6923_03620 [Alphaproteobacteria bacterium]|nr:hypothetical protein [Alphaproteobacteria bacterium]
MRIEEFVTLTAERHALSQARARRAVASLLELVKAHVGREEAQAFLQKLPDAEHLLATASDRAGVEPFEGIAARLDMRRARRLKELKSLARLARVGLPPNEVGTFVARFAEFASAHAGDETTAQVLSRIPGLEEFF